MLGFPLRPTLRTLVITAGAAFLVAGIATQPSRVLADNSPTLGAPEPATMPTPPAEVSVPVDSTQRHHRHHHKDKGDSSTASATPEPSPSTTPSAPVYTTFAGTWELAIQPGQRTIYTHILFAPTEGNTLSGKWAHDNVTTDISGEIDGDRFRLAGTSANGPFTMTGYEESSTTMVGLIIQGATRTPFTATHQGGVGGKLHHGHTHAAKSRRHG